MNRFLDGTMQRDAKRQKLILFREVVGGEVPESHALGCLEKSSYDIDRAVDMYFSSSFPSTAVDLDAPEIPPVASGVTEGVLIGIIVCMGSLTTKLSASSNELYMDTLLNCSYSIRPPTTSHVATPTELLDLIHGSGFVRFALRGNKSEIGRLPAPLASAISPLVRLGLIDAFVSVGFPGCAGMNLNPGASVPLKIEIFATEKSMKRNSMTSSEYDLLLERINQCWSVILTQMDVVVDQGSEGKIIDDPISDPITTTTSDEPLDDPIDPASMSTEMSRIVDVFSQPELPKISPKAEIFNTSLQPYQQQALWWMVSREHCTHTITDLPEYLQSNIVIPVDAMNPPPDTTSAPSSAPLPPGWFEIRTPGDETWYYSDGHFAADRPPALLTPCRGGILADEMGLGKTVMTLSLISLDQNMQSSPAAIFSNRELPGGTLVVLHLSLLRQWKGELERHAPKLTYIEFHGTDRLNVDLRRLASVHVVFTTYGTVPIALENSPLMQVKWRRVVLDEAHTIRTRSTKMAKAVAKLNAERRWCLTGTPLQNSVEDIYPLIAWLRVTPWRSYAYFRREILAKMNGEEGLSRLQTMLKPIMLRRTKATRLADGTAIVQLPPRRNKIIRIDLSEEEKDFYRALFWETKLEFDKFEKSNNVMYHMTHILQLLIRLRQALCHPALCRTTLRCLPEGDENPSTLDELLKHFMESAAGPTQYFSNLISDLRQSGIENMECPICLSEPCQFPVMTPCGHAMCRKCCVSRLRRECPICRAVFANSEMKLLTSLKDGEAGSEADPDSPVCPPLSSKLRALLDYLQRDLRKNRRVIVFSQFVSFIDIISKVFVAKKIPFRTLHGGHNPTQREAAVDWLTNADIAKEHYSDPSWVDRVGTGCIAPSDDEDDTESPQPLQGRVLLVSLKAGGVGLNLIAANVVYLTDLWWNPSVEEQAFQRVHRLGQTKNVLTYKFVCEETIDERILDLQATKSDMTADVLGDVSTVTDTNRNSTRKLTLEDIRQLFKPNQIS
jgi:SNF2 family DNA or RNA helicase